LILNQWICSSLNFDIKSVNWQISEALKLLMMNFESNDTVHWVTRLTFYCLASGRFPWHPTRSEIRAQRHRLVDMDGIIHRNCGRWFRKQTLPRSTPLS
jgi:hypothetical protein